MWVVMGFAEVRSDVLGKWRSGSRHKRGGEGARKSQGRLSTQVRERNEFKDAASSSDGMTRGDR